MPAILDSHSHDIAPAAIHQPRRSYTHTHSLSLSLSLPPLFLPIHTHQRVSSGCPLFSLIDTPDIFLSQATQVATRRSLQPPATLPLCFWQRRGLLPWFGNPQILCTRVAPCPSLGSDLHLSSRASVLLVSTTRTSLFRSAFHYLVSAFPCLVPLCLLHSYLALTLPLPLPPFPLYLN
ncbi:hypothetical protein H4582DRAFT_639564 [Lactarius indigo]|nr:hypothetical protein H4582DRAFT_639564 [Lactarius indigo]